MDSDDDMRPDPQRHDTVQFGSRRPPRQVGRLGWLLVAVGLVAVGSIVAVEHHLVSSSPPSSVSASSSSPTAGAWPSAPALTRSSATPTMSEPTVTTIGRPLLATSGDWSLFVRGQNAGLQGEVVRIQLASGRVTYTTIPTLESTGVVAFLAAAGQAIVRPIEDVPGYTVPDGKPARELSGQLSQGGIVLPGPKPGQLWVNTSTAREMHLVDMDGAPPRRRSPADSVHRPHRHRSGAAIRRRRLRVDPHRRRGL